MQNYSNFNPAILDLYYFPFLLIIPLQKSYILQLHVQPYYYVHIIFMLPTRKSNYRTYAYILYIYILNL